MQSQPSLLDFDPIGHCTEKYQSQLEKSPIYKLLLSNVRMIIDSSPNARGIRKGHFGAEMTVQPIHVNSLGIFHGVASACIVDWAGGMAIETCGKGSSGVSTDIHVSYLSSAKLGDELVITATADKVGGSLAYTSIRIEKRVKGGENVLVATGSHTKFVKN